MKKRRPKGRFSEKLPGTGQANCASHRGKGSDLAIFVFFLGPTTVRVLRTKVAKSLGTCEKSSACQRDFKKGETPIYSSRCEAVRLGADPKDMIYRD